MTGAATSRDTLATPTQVWAVLADGHTYDRWVPGTKEIRSVDPEWPAEGSALHYTLGFGPVEQKDRTVVLTADQRRYLELEIHFDPLGTVRVAITITPRRSARGCTVTIDEHPFGGCLAVFRRRLIEALTRFRTADMLERLIAVVEDDTDAPPDTTDDPAAGD